MVPCSNVNRRLGYAGLIARSGHPLPSAAEVSIMKSRELVETALRVLNDWSHGHHTDLTDFAVLRQHALPEELGLPSDELACRIVFREAIQDARTDRKRPLRIVRNRKIA